VQGKQQAAVRGDQSLVLILFASNIFLVGAPSAVIADVAAASDAAAVPDTAAVLDTAAATAVTPVVAVVATGVVVVYEVPCVVVFETLPSLSVLTRSMHLFKYRHLLLFNNKRM